MKKLISLQLLWFSILWILRTEKTIALDWPVSSTSVKLIGIFPQETDGKSKNNMWTIHCSSMFRAAILLSQKYNITFQNEFIGYDEIITDHDVITIAENTCKKVSISNIVGFVGPAYSSEAQYLASLAKRLGITGISYSATASDLSAIDNGAFFRVVPSDENTVLSLAILFQQYKWKSSVIIYQNDEYGINGMQLLKEKFGEVGIKTRETIKFHMNEQIFQINLQQTLVNSLSRIVILWADTKSTITILKQAFEENLLGPDFLWILTTTIPLDDFNQRQRQALVGVLSVEPIIGGYVDQPINTTLLNQAYEIWKYYQPDTFPSDGNVNSYALYAFDATWAFILALQKFCSMQLSCLQIQNASACYDRRFYNSKQYYDTIKTMSFLGVSGEVKFSNGTPDRVGHQYYIIKNIQSTNSQRQSIAYVPVLQWDADSTKWQFYKNQSSDIIWPNWSKNVPKDYKLIQGCKISVSNKFSTYSNLKFISKILYFLQL